MKETYRIPEQNLAKVTEAISKLNRKAQKLNCPEITLTETGTFELVEIKNDHGKGTGTFDKFLEIIVEGETPKYSGWTFIAVIEPSTEGNFLRTIPGESLPTEWRIIDQHCDHCNVKRYRKETYVVRNEQGTLKQVGSTCIKDFLGGNNPHVAARRAEWLMTISDLIEEAQMPGSGGSYYLQTEAWLTWVAVAIRNYGWLSKGKAWEENQPERATARMADYLMASTRLQPEEHPTDEDKAVAAEALKWGRERYSASNGDKIENLSDYEWNLNVAIAEEVLSPRQMGIVASLIPFWKRQIETELIAKETANSEWIGEPKQRLQFDNLKVVFEQSYESEWGITILYKFVDEDGNELVWWASKFQEFEVGAIVSGKATVKKHDLYNDKKQTYINRAKFAQIETQEA